MLGEKEQRKWRFSDVGEWLKNAFLATIKGEFLLRLHVSKYFIHIIYTFFLHLFALVLPLEVYEPYTR